MNKDTLKGKWMEMKGSLKSKWGKLTDDDLKQIEGNREQLLGKLQERYGYGKEEAERHLNDFENQRRAA